MGSEALHELTAGYALDALDEGETGAYEEHLAHCERCRHDLAAFGDTVTALAYAASGPAPPAELRERILERARAERPNVVPLHLRRRLVPYALAAVAACAAIGLGIWGASVSQTLDRERSARDQDARVGAIVADSGARRVPLTGDAGTLVVTKAGDAALLLSRIDPPPDGKTYQAWVAEGRGTPRPAGTFEGEALAIALDRRVPEDGLVMVTLERDGGADVPTGAPVFRASAA